jgi:hypothetical protein
VLFPCQRTSHLRPLLSFVSLELQFPVLARIHNPCSGVLCCCALRVCRCLGEKQYCSPDVKCLVWHLPTTQACCGVGHINGMAEDLDEPETSYIVLKSGTFFDFLEHRGTGEIQPLGCRCSLTFSDDGFGYVTGDEDFGTKWVSDVLTQSLKRGRGGRVYIHDSSDGTTTWLSELQEAGSASKVFSHEKAGASWVTEVYHSLQLFCRGSSYSVATAMSAA